MGLIVAALEPWAAKNRGRVFPASDVVDCIDQLRSKPGTATAAVLWVKETPRTPELSILGRVDRLFKIVISRGRGFKIVSGESLTGGVAGGRALFDLVEEARELLAALRMEDMEEDEQPVYEGAGPFEVDGIVWDAVEIRLTLAAQTGMPAEEE